MYQPFSKKTYIKTQDSISKKKINNQRQTSKPRFSLGPPNTIKVKTITFLPNQTEKTKVFLKRNRQTKDKISRDLPNKNKASFSGPTGKEKTYYFPQPAIETTPKWKPIIPILIITGKEKKQD